MKSLQIGIMSGRLSPQIDNKIQLFPVDTWEDEFRIASVCGFDSIEWIFDQQKNPILDEQGLSKMKELSNKFNVQINSICCDYFMEKLLFNVSEFELSLNLEILTKLIESCNKLGIQMLEIPLVDSSSLQTSNDENQIVTNLDKHISLAETNDIIFTFETDLQPKRFEGFLKKFTHTNIAANYDTGNSASLGYDVTEELSTLGSWITNIHIKDRLFRGKSVTLGTGNTNFDLFFSELKKIKYDGELIIQGARNDSQEQPETTCKKYLDFVKQYLHKYSL
ncbi:sugar phosphate isomerase/epimerase family protein [Candidatus Nitrosotenuis cloacae]|uniref:sugar phosphate isomerase/epimerase family protein n=1 Tax=Candidatus Nitrosotenuis cloacae TaxID=1603555 RepID=UPI00228099D6|nr:sugar phosphate isomerase/epimerase [Candidatus Nitrosotenuis cloacae]